MNILRPPQTNGVSNLHDDLWIFGSFAHHSPSTHLKNMFLKFDDLPNFWGNFFFKKIFSSHLTYRQIEGTMVFLKYQGLRWVSQPPTPSGSRSNRPTPPGLRAFALRLKGSNSLRFFGAVIHLSCLSRACFCCCCCCCCCWFEIHVTCHVLDNLSKKRWIFVRLSGIFFYKLYTASKTNIKKEAVYSLRGCI